MDSTKPMTLYTITAEIMAVLIQTDENGELAPETETKLHGLEGDLKWKADNVARFMRQMDAEASGYKLEAERLAKLAKTQSNKADRLKAYLKECLEMAGIDNLDTELFKFTICTNSQPSVTIQEGAPIPKAFQRVKIELDAKKVAEAWANKKKLPPTITVKRGTHLRIR